MWVEGDFAGKALADVGDIVRGMAEYRKLFKVRHHAHIEASVDTEGVSEEWYRLIRSLEKFPRAQSKENIWELAVKYSEAYKGSYDYSKVLNVGRAPTEYRRSGPTVMKEVKFKFDRCAVQSPTGTDLADIERDFIEMSNILTKARAASGSLASWVQAGFDMYVICQKCPRLPMRSETISHDRLAGFDRDGWNLEILSHKLVCKRCGARAPKVGPT